VRTVLRDMTGSELRHIRKRLGLTQAALAERLAVTPTTVARWERGELPIHEPRARHIRLFARTERPRPGPAKAPARGVKRKEKGPR